MGQRCSGGRSAKDTRALRAGLGALALASACTYVSLESDGKAVQMLEQSQLGASCQKIGVVSSQTLSRILFFPRNPEKIAAELSTSARNRGGELGGDAIVPATPIEGGKQRFDLYRCSQT